MLGVLVEQRLILLSFLGAVLGVYGSIRATCFVVFITSVISSGSSGLKRYGSSTFPIFISFSFDLYILISKVSEVRYSR